MSSIPHRPLVDFLEAHADLILNIISPLVWIAMFLSAMDRESVISLWYMPFLGFFAAFLANSIPIGGGIVYIPALSLIGAPVTLGASFTIATMPLGNGVFGFLRWLIKDPTVLIWDSFPYSVLPSWIGAFIAITLLPTVDASWVKLFFGLFCFVLAMIVVGSIYRGGLREALFPSAPPKAAAVVEPTILVDLAEAQPTLISVEPVHDWSPLILVSFLGGLILVPNIGIGPALLTCFMLVIMGYTEQQAMVTGIVTGGWVCVLPFVLNALLFDNVPTRLWIMVLPGVFLGAKYAPRLIDWVGKEIIMKAFAAFLFASAALFWFH